MSQFLPDIFTFFPIWSMGTWNSVCITISSTAATFRLNINGHVVLQNRNIFGILESFDNFKKCIFIIFLRMKMNTELTLS